MLRLHLRAICGLALSAGCAHQAPPKEAPPPPTVQEAPRPRQEASDEMKVSGTLGTLNDDEIAGPFQRRWNDITRCYDDVAQKQQYLGGKIEVKLRVTPTDDPKSAWV